MANLNTVGIQAITEEHVKMYCVAIVDMSLPFHFTFFVCFRFSLAFLVLSYMYMYVSQCTPFIFADM